MGALNSVMQWLAYNAVALLFPIYIAGTCCVLLVIVRLNRTFRRLGGLEQEVRSARSEIETLLKVVDEQANIIAKLDGSALTNADDDESAGQNAARREIEAIRGEFVGADGSRTPESVTR